MHLRFLGIAAALLSFSSAGHASVLDFSSMPGTNTQPFSSYTEDGYLIINTTGQYLIGTYFGDPVPNLFSGSSDAFFAPAATSTAAITITRVDGGAFTFASADLADDSVSGTYSFTGSLDGSQVYTSEGDIESTLFESYLSGEAKTGITSLTIAESGGDFNVDNIVVTAPATSVTPEPSSLLLLATGLVGVAGNLRKRIA